MRIPVVLALSISLGACGDSECAQRIAAMRRTFEKIPAKAVAQVVIVEPGFPLPESTGGEVLRTRGPLVRIDAGGRASVEDGPPRDVDALIAEVAEHLTRPGQDRALYLAIAPTTPVAPHVGLLTALGEQAPLRVLVREPASAALAAPTASPATAARLAAITTDDPLQKARLLADAMQAAVGTCKPLTTTFESLATVAPDRRQAELINAALAGAETCGCDVVDVDGLTALVWVLIMGDGPPLRWLPMLPGSAGAPVPATATGADLASALAHGPAVALPG